MNPRGFGPDNEEKVEMMKKSIREFNIDRVLLSSPDQKWSTAKIDRLKRTFKQINKDVEIIATDSGQSARTEKGYLPGGTLNIIIGPLVGMIMKRQNRTDALGRWSTFVSKEITKLFKL